MISRISSNETPSKSESLKSLNPSIETDERSVNRIAKCSKEGNEEEYRSLRYWVRRGRKVWRDEREEEGKRREKKKWMDCGLKERRMDEDNDDDDDGCWVDKEKEKEIWEEGIDCKSVKKRSFHGDCNVLESRPSSKVGWRRWIEGWEERYCEREEERRLKSWSIE